MVKAAAEQGYADSQFNVGWMYDEGNGVVGVNFKMISEPGRLP